MYASVKTTLASGINFELDVMQTDISVNDNPQSPSYPALSYLGKPVMPGKAGSPFTAPVLWIGRALGSAFPSPLAPRDYANSRISLGLNGTFSGRMGDQLVSNGIFITQSVNKILIIFNQIQVHQDLMLL